MADIMIVASRAVPDRPQLAQNVRVNERVARRPRLPGSAWEPKKKRDRSKRPWRTWARVDVMAARRRSFPRSFAHPLGLERSPLCERCSTATTASQGAHVFAFRLSMLTVDFLLPSEPHRSPLQKWPKFELQSLKASYPSLGLLEMCASNTPRTRYHTIFARTL